MQPYYAHHPGRSSGPPLRPSAHPYPPPDMPPIQHRTGPYSNNTMYPADRPAQADRRRVKRGRACDLCRRKKIRCDYDETHREQPCSSCASYNKTCTFQEAARKRGPPKGYVEGLENRLQRMEQLLQKFASSGQVSTESLEDLHCGNTPRTEEDDDDDDDDEEQRDERDEDTPSDAHEDAATPHSTSSTAASSSNTTRAQTILSELCKRQREGAYSYHGSSSGIQLISAMLPKQALVRVGGFQYPGGSSVNDFMVMRHPDDLDQVMFKEERSATTLQLPPQELLNHLVQLYFTHANIYLPIVDEDEFRQNYAAAKDGPLLNVLAMAMARVGTRLLDRDDPIAQKYAVNATKLFDDLTEQVKQCHWHMLEPRIESIQILLLVASHAQKWSPESTDWMAISIAVKMAQDFGLHRSHAIGGLPGRNSEARKRLWWCAYVLDRWICGCLGRPLVISDADCDVEDIEVPDDPSRSHLAFLYHMAKLASILGDILRILCSPRARSLAHSQYEMEQVCANLKQALNAWEQRLPPHLKLTPRELDQIARKDVRPELAYKLNTSGAGPLRLAFYAVTILVHRPLIVMDNTEATVSMIPQESIDAADGIVDLLHALKRSSLLSFGWSMTNYFLSQGIMVNFLSLRHDNPDVKRQAKDRQQRYIQEYRSFEPHIDKGIVTFLETLSKMVADDNATNEEETAPSVENQTLPFWGASSGLDWQDFMAVVANGYPA